MSTKTEYQKSTNFLFDTDGKTDIKKYLFQLYKEKNNLILILTSCHHFMRFKLKCLKMQIFS